MGRRWARGGGGGEGRARLPFKQQGVMLIDVHSTDLGVAATCQLHMTACIPIPPTGPWDGRRGQWSTDGRTLSLPKKKGSFRGLPKSQGDGPPGPRRPYQKFRGKKWHFCNRGVAGVQRNYRLSCVRCKKRICPSKSPPKEMFGRFGWWLINGPVHYAPFPDAPVFGGSIDTPAHPNLKTRLPLRWNAPQAPLQFCDRSSVRLTLFMGLRTEG